MTAHDSDTQSTLVRDLDSRMRGRVPLLFGGATNDLALMDEKRGLTYGELASAVAELVDDLGPARRLILLEAHNDIPTVITYLAALAGRHAVLVGADDPDRQAHILGTYRPDVVSTRDGIQVRRDAGGHRLHPELAVLLSTSGSTGSPKLVRLSRTNIESNARSIATYLGLRAEDRAVTSLPLHYCYGLSVLNSHLHAGGSVVLSGHSVADERFWDLAACARVTGFAGVPYTFDLLDATGFADRELPSLRYVTQAGGRMAPEKIRRYAELGKRRGWDLFVMYGQTEATARMAYLPPEMAARRPTAIGVAIPGGELRIDPLVGAGADPTSATGKNVGELVYTGPNVMMGYANHAADLSRGDETAELRTGDLARRASDGLFEITGRLDRSVKLFGMRVDLDHVETRLTAAGCPARVVADGETVYAFTTRPRSRQRTKEALAAAVPLPSGTVDAHVVPVIPLTASGKCDYAALADHAAVLSAGIDEGRDLGVRDLYAAVLGRPDATGSDTFTSLGGDSLSFVEVSARLSQRLGRLPRDWHLLSIDEVSRGRRERKRFTTHVDISVTLRAFAIVLVVITHTDLLLIMGGAHVLLAAAGHNLGRFTLRASDRRNRTRRLAMAMAAIAVPASVWIAGCSVLTGDYRLSTALYLNGFLGSGGWTLDWQFWFLELLVWTYVAVAILLALPTLDRWQRRWPFATAMVVVGMALAMRYATIGLSADLTEEYTIAGSLWVFVLGWAAADARRTTQRIAVTGVMILALIGFFPEDLPRTGVVGVGILLLIWARPLPIPNLLAHALRVIAGASLWIYLTHWQVYPDLEAAGHAPTAVLASLTIGIGCSVLAGRGAVLIRQLRTGRGSPRIPGSVRRRCLNRVVGACPEP